MTLYGLGTEIVETARIARMVERHGDAFLRRVFTEREIQRCNEAPLGAEKFAACWAGKQAALRSLNQERPPQPGDWRDFEIDLEAIGQARVLVGGASKSWVMQLPLTDLVVTIAHCRSYATATALAFGKAPGRNGSG